MEMTGKKIMIYKKILILMVTFTLTISAIGCGVSKSDHEMIVKELEKANQDKAALSDQINQLKAENESLAQKVSNLESENNTLQLENEGLKAKPAAKKKPAVQPKPNKK